MAGLAKFSALAAALTTLAGCASIDRIEDRLGWWNEASGFAAAHQHRAVHAAAAVAPTPVAASPADLALAKCKQDLYQSAPATQEDLRAAEAKCRQAILAQPY